MLFSLIENLEKLDIVLASVSPRRFELLKQIGLEFKVIPSDFEEEIQHQSSIRDLVLHNARHKGLSVAEQNPKALVISADTVVAIDDQVLGKPENEDDAFRMLQLLSGKTHQVYTGVGLFLKEYEGLMLDTVCTNVTFRPLSEEEILAYINTGEPFDKAGAYGIQGQGALLVERIEGCYYNVVGFPLTKFFLMLKEFMKHYIIG
ncbi:Maf family protein [Calditrichota bacterium LG25]